MLSAHVKVWPGEVAAEEEEDVRVLERREQPALLLQVVHVLLVAHRIVWVYRHACAHNQPSRIQLFAQPAFQTEVVTCVPEEGRGTGET